MTSVTNSSGLNYQNGVNPLGRKVRALESDVDVLKKELAALKTGGVKTTAGTQEASPLLAELDALRREVATMKAAGFGKGEKGEKGDKGDKGDKGEPGPMTYIAMPPTMMSQTAPATPLAAQVVA
jgi:hypothetical protein